MAREPTMDCDRADPAAASMTRRANAVATLTAHHSFLCFSMRQLGRGAPAKSESHYSAKVAARELYLVARLTALSVASSAGTRESRAGSRLCGTPASKRP